MEFNRRHGAGARALGELSKWVLLFGGVALLGIGMLTEPWLEVCRLRGDRDLMRAQADRLVVKAAAHRRLAMAIEDRDPTVLERLAYEQMRVTPEGTAVVAMGVGDTGGVWSVQRWVDVPPVGAGVDVAGRYAEESLMVRLSSGVGRLWMAGVGMLCVAAGVWPGTEGCARSD